MKTLLLGLIATHCVTPFAFAAPSEKLGDFELTDQEAKALFFDSAFVCAIDFNPLENDMQIWHRGLDVRPEPAWIGPGSPSSGGVSPYLGLFQISWAKLRLSLLWTRKRWVALSLAGILLVSGTAQGAVITVVSSGGFAVAYRALAPEFERTTGNTLATSWGPSMGNTPEAVPSRLRRGEPIDVVIMVGYALSDLIKEGKVIADSRVDLARSSIGIAVRAGAPKPDISSVDAVRSALLAAKSIAYSDSASGVYISSELFRRLGIADQVASKSRMIPAEPVGAVVARGEAELGFQQISELKPIAGIDLVGPLPPDLQKITIFSAGIVVGAREPDAAKALITFLASPAAATAIKESGMEPMKD